MASGGFAHSAFTPPPHVILEHILKAVCLTCHRLITARSSTSRYQSAGSQRQPSPPQLIALASQAFGTPATHGAVDMFA